MLKFLLVIVYVTFFSRRCGWCCLCIPSLFFIGLGLGLEPWHIDTIPWYWSQSWRFKNVERSILIFYWSSSSNISSLSLWVVLLLLLLIFIIFRFLFSLPQFNWRFASLIMFPSPSVSSFELFLYFLTFWNIWGFFLIYLNKL